MLVKMTLLQTLSILPPPPTHTILSRKIGKTFFSFSILSKLVAILLLVAVVAKLHGLGWSPVERSGIFSRAEFQIALIEFEILLAIWLFSGRQAIACWLVTIVTFTTFAAVSFSQGWQGQSSCGCLGAIKVNPWHAFALDAVVLCVLLVGRPAWPSPRPSLRSLLKSAMDSSVYPVTGMVLIAVVMIGLAHWGFGSVPAALAYFRGERISIAPRPVDVGAGRRGESRTISVTLSNWTDHPIAVFGGTADCSCTVMDDLPVTIPAKESRAVSIAVRFSGPPGVFTRRAGFHINDQGFKRIDFYLTGQIMPSAPGD